MPCVEILGSIERPFSSEQPGPCTIAEFRVVANTTIALCGQTLNKSRSNRSKQGLQAATDRLYEPENF